MSAISVDDIVQMGNEAHADGYKEGFAAGDASGYRRGLADAGRKCRTLADLWHGEYSTVAYGAANACADAIAALLPPASLPAGGAGDDTARVRAGRAGTEGETP